MKRFSVILILITLPLRIHACYNSESYPKWSFLFYYGKMTNEDLGQVILLDYSLNDATLYSIEIAKELNPTNPFRLFFQPLVSFVDIRGNFTLLEDEYDRVYEINPYFTLNWNNFPWCHHLKTTVSVGEGISYISKVPYAEEINSDKPKKLLNFLIGEIAFALPSYPQFEIIVRIHHRSGAFGIYHANNAGSTAVGIALRYHFSSSH